LYRSPTQTSCRPLNGWKGWVIRTSRVDTIEAVAFRVELQASGARAFRVAASHQWHGFSYPSAVIDVAGRHRLATTRAHLGAAVVGV